jgi:hypothetical protein
MESSDKAENDKGNNFGRIARSGLLDDYLAKIKVQDYLGIRVVNWMKFFKAMSENRTSNEIDKQLDGILSTIQADLKTKKNHEQLLILQTLVDNLRDLMSKM